MGHPAVPVYPVNPDSTEGDPLWTAEGIPPRLGLNDGWIGNAAHERNAWMKQYMTSYGTHFRVELGKGNDDVDRADGTFVLNFVDTSFNNIGLIKHIVNQDIFLQFRRNLATYFSLISYFHTSNNNHIPRHIATISLYWRMAMVIGRRRRASRDDVRSA